jgi:hypothetical protein
MVAHGGEIVTKKQKVVNYFLKAANEKAANKPSPNKPLYAHVNASNLHLQPKGGARLVNATKLHL